MNVLPKLAILCAALLLLAIAPLPYAYYQLLRVIIAGVAGLNAIHSQSSGRSTLGWMWIAVAILFNPVIPLIFGKGIWRVIDFLVALLFAASALHGRPQTRKSLK